MSKLIETLQHTEDKKPTPVNSQKTSYELTQEQLADVYFSGGGKTKKEDSPLVIKVIEKTRAPVSVLPWLIASMAFLLLALSLFTTKRIFVDIKVIDDKILMAGQEDSGVASEEMAGYETQIPSSFLPLDRVRFFGAAQIKSMANEKMLTLVNSSVANFARADYEFRPYRDFEGKRIVFYARGQNGGETFAFSLRDRENVPAFRRSKLFPFENGLTTHWQKAEIVLTDADTVKEFDPKSVAMLRFDFGSKDTSNRNGDTIFIKDVEILPV